MDQHRRHGVNINDTMDASNEQEGSYLFEAIEEDDSEATGKYIQAGATKDAQGNPQPRFDAENNLLRSNRLSI